MPGSEPVLRLGVFGFTLFAMMIFELLAPRRPLTVGRVRRWPSNLGIVIVDTLLIRILFPAAAVGWALLVQARGWGLLNQFVLPVAAQFAIAFVALDLIIYLQHILFHWVPVLWRLHRVHHADLDFDVTTGVRFHPVEILISMLVKFAAIVVVGAPAIAVMAFEIILNAATMFNHGNVALPGGVDRILRRIIVTPDMHRVHHSILAYETHSNFGFNFAWWDRLLGTYRAQPEAGHSAMTIGLPMFRGVSELRLDRMLLQPLRQDRAS